MFTAALTSSGAVKHVSFTAPVAVGQFDVAYDEISDLTCPGKNANAPYIWAVDDGLVTGVIAINKTTVAAAGFWTVTGFTAIDLECLTSFVINGQPYLVLGDTGNNANAANSRGTGIDVRIARCKEPTITGSNGTINAPDVELIDCAYPTDAGAPVLRDCECIIADTNGDIYFFLKRSTPIRVYRLPYAISYTGTQVLTYMGEMSADATLNTISTTSSGNNGYITGGSRSFSGREWYFCNYDRWFAWRKRAGETVIQMVQRVYDFKNEDDHIGKGRFKWQPAGLDQREAIVVDRDNNLFQTSEHVAAKSFGTVPYPALFKSTRLNRPVTRVTFQHGANGYSGCVDGTIDSAAPTLDNSTAANMIADYNFGTYPAITQDRQGLLRFDLTSLPAGAIITAAYLDLYVTAEGQGVDFYKALVTWNAASTWNSLGAGMPHDGVKASSVLSIRLGETAAERANIDGILSQMFRFPLPIADVQGWITTPGTNFGYVIKGNFLDTTGDGMQFATSKTATVAQRPLLTLYYYVP